MTISNRFHQMKNLLRIIKALSVSGALAASVASLLAHHSTTMFDYSKTLTIDGEVVELRWVNPHVSLSIKGIVKELPEQGVALWLMEMTSPGNLVRAGGWRRDAVKPGDQVEVLFSPLRDAERKGGTLRKLTVIATGEVFTANIFEQERPGLE
jgi:Family of unknown function (DUF6152)